jgi:hypothetical protein
MTDPNRPDPTSRCARCALPYGAAPAKMLRFKIDLNGKLFRIFDLCADCAELPNIGDWLSPVVQALAADNRTIFPAPTSPTRTST